MKKPINNRSLERALHILGAFSTKDRKLSLPQLSANLDLPKSTVYRLCVTLINNDFLKYDEQAGQYSLGLKLFHLGAIVSASFSVSQSASPHLAILQKKTSKTILLGVLQDGNLMYLDKREDVTSPIRFNSEIGMLRQPYFGMLGQTLLAYLPAKEVAGLINKRPLKPVTERSIKTKKELTKRLALIRRRGFVFEEEEVIDGVGGIAAPIFNQNREVVAAVGLRFILSADGRRKKEKMIKQVCETARAISTDLGLEAL
jgi:IclR family transcriptional regulator, KDG regulon repressor